MQAIIVLRKIAGCCHALRRVALACSKDFDTRAKAIAIATAMIGAIALVHRTLEFDCHPVAGIGRRVVQQRSPGPEVHFKRIDFSIVVVVRETCAARRGALAQHRTCFARHVGELVVAGATKHGVFLGNEMNQTTMKDKDVEQSVIVEVIDACSPTDVLRIGLGDSGLCANIFEGHLAGL